MQSLGMIETKGLVALVEATDTMLKTANVNFLKIEKIGAGLVSVIITGDVSAVKTAVDAGVRSVENLGDDFLKSYHVIARASDDLNLLFQESKLDFEKNKEVFLGNDENTKDENFKQVEIVEYEENLKTEENTLQNKEVVLEEVFLNRDNVDEYLRVNSFERFFEELEKLRLSDIRHILKKYKNLSISHKDISKSSKKRLIEELKMYYERGEQ